MNRPKIKPELSITDKIVEGLGWISVVSIWTLILINYAELPAIISIHYNATGQADAFGGKNNILILPLVATVLFSGLTLLNKFPHIFNYPTDITKENALIHYTNATRMIRYLKLIIVFIFGLISLQTIRNAEGQTSGLGVWFLPLVLALIFIPIIYFLIRLSKETK